MCVVCRRQVMIELPYPPLSVSTQEFLRFVSCSPLIDGIRAPIYLLHDRADDSIPFTESRNFAAALTRLGHPHDFAEFGIFHHVQVRPDIGVEQSSRA